MGSEEGEHLYYRVIFEGDAEPIAFVAAVPAGMHPVHFRGMVENGPILDAMIRRQYGAHAGRSWSIVSCEPITEAQRAALAPCAPEAVQYVYPSWVDLAMNPEAYGPPEPES